MKTNEIEYLELLLTILYFSNEFPSKYTCINQVSSKLLGKELNLNNIYTIYNFINKIYIINIFHLPY